MKLSEPSQKYIEYICSLYGDKYDDNSEDSKPPAGGKYKIQGKDWFPWRTANHKSIVAFQRELKDKGIMISSTKIRKILITGGCWSTERSREINLLFDKYTSPVCDGGLGLSSDAAVTMIAKELCVSRVTVSVNLPYQNVVYKLKNRSTNAERCKRYRNRKKGSTICKSASQNFLE